jgi:hypothetical protein
MISKMAELLTFLDFLNSTIPQKREETEGPRGHL